MPADVPVDCPVDSCSRSFLDVDNEQERLAQIKQHLYQGHADDLADEEIVKHVEDLPGLTEL